MKYLLILGLITLTTFASGKPVIRDEKHSKDIEILLDDILTVLKDPKNGYPYTLVKVNSVNGDKESSSLYPTYDINADLKDKNGEVQTCPGVIRAYVSEVTFYDIQFWCPSGTFKEVREIV